MPAFMMIALRAVFSPLGRILAIAAMIVAAALYVHHTGERSGEAKVERAADKTHTAVVADERRDERTAASSAAAIASDTARQTDAAAVSTQQTIEDLHHAIDIPAAPIAASLPATPVDSLRASLNASINRANRAADAADAIP